jgi:hypothetical protein
VNAGAWIMFFVGAIGLWGGLILFIMNYFSKARQDSGDDGSNPDE